MSEKLEYLGRTLNARSYAAATEASKALAAIIAKNAAGGRLASGATLRSFEMAALESFQNAFVEAAKFAFNLMESTGSEVAGPLGHFAGRAQEVIYEHVRTASLRLGLPEPVVAGQLAKIKGALEERKSQLIDDFAHGMMGNERMKKDPLVTLIANQTNSPGAVQQLGMGTFSQNALVQNRQELVQTINEVIASSEFTALAPAQKEAFTDIADALKDEAAKSNPDVGKLKRWGNRLIEFGEEVGMKVAVNTISQVLSRIFTT